MSGDSPALIEGAPLRSPVPPLTVPQFFCARAGEFADRAALIEAASGRRYTYADLQRLLGRFAAGLAALGFQPGDTLLLFMPNLPEWPIAALGTMAAGGIVSGANSMHNAAELAKQLRAAAARFVVTVPSFLGTVREALAQVGPATVILLGEAPGTVSFASLLACTAAEPAVAVSPDALAALPFSSGTSGLPKGVMLTHRNILTNVAQCRESLAAGDEPVWLAFLPMFHIYGFTFTLYSLIAGGTLVTLPRFEPEPFLKALQDYRVTHLSVVPPVMQFLAAHPLVDSYDLGSLKHIGCGAAPLDGAFERKVGARIGCSVTQGFGMTESSGVIAVTYPGRHRAGSCGELLPATQLRVVDPGTQLDLGRGSCGEIWFRGPQAFQGYLNDPQTTAETITADGWVRTGDIGYVDSEGYLYITDRLKELIKVKGFQVAPAELEALLHTHPLVADAAVIGRAHERAGQLPVAYVVAREPIDPEELKSWVAQRVIDYKRLGDVVFCQSIPRSAAGKILRRVLRAQDAQRSGQRA